MLLLGFANWHLGEQRREIDGTFVSKGAV